MTKPTYHTSLPPQVRFDEELSANAKLLYGEIKALCDQQGYCWASNHYLATLYQVEKKTVSRWIAQLEARHYVWIEAEKTIGNQRRIYLTSDPSKWEEVPSQKGIAHPIPMEGYPLKKTCKTPSPLIDNYIDYNDRIHSASTPQGRDISMDKEKITRAERKLQNDSASGQLHRRYGQPPVAGIPVAPPPLPPPKKDAASLFVKPSVKEAEDYMLSQKELCASALTARAQALRFVNYYESNGWKVGRNAMQDWRAAANNWLLNAQTYDTKNSTPRTNQRLHSPTRRNQRSDNPGGDYYSVPL